MATERQKAAARANLVKARAARKRKGGGKSQAMRVRTHHTAAAVPAAIHGKPVGKSVIKHGRFHEMRQAVKAARAKAGLNQLEASRAHRALQGRVPQRKSSLLNGPRA